MRTSTGAINHNGRNGNSISPYKSFSTGNQPCPSPYTASSPVIATPPARKFMEDVWKDISLASLHDPSYNTTLSSTVITTTTHKPAFCGMTLQDFLARPLSKDRPTRFASSGTGVDHSSALETTLLGSPAPLPATILSLKSGSDFAYLQSSCTPIGPNPRLQRHVSFSAPSCVSSFNSVFNVSGSSLVLPSFCKRRAQENDDNPGDRRNKRMIKNRESAARSRARKQVSVLSLEHLKHSRVDFHTDILVLSTSLFLVLMDMFIFMLTDALLGFCFIPFWISFWWAYTSELQLEVARLQEENARLKRQQKELCVAANAHFKKKNIASTEPQLLHFEK